MRSHLSFRVRPDGHSGHRQDIRFVRGEITKWQSAIKIAAKARTAAYRARRAYGPDAGAEYVAAERIALETQRDVVVALASWTRPEYAHVLDDARCPAQLRAAALGLVLFERHWAHA